MKTYAAGTHLKHLTEAHWEASNEYLQCFHGEKKHMLLYLLEVTHLSNHNIFFRKKKYQCPVIQSIVCLLVKYNINSQVFLLLKFFSKKISIHTIFNDQSFKDMLTNDIVCCEQMGPVLFGWKKKCLIWNNVMSTNNPCFYGEIKKISAEISPNTSLERLHIPQK